MNGRIWVNSEGLGKGATFVFSLPVASAQILEHADQFHIKAKGEAKGLEPVAI
ncbi:MAG: Sensor protein [Microgenomates group bacterium Gr01-1014_93]|nr:MAG: Sensor protein [Microgenomates group bacterium Gr01-1014_93]